MDDDEQRPRKGPSKFKPALAPPPPPQQQQQPGGERHPPGRMAVLVPSVPARRQPNPAPWKAMPAQDVLETPPSPHPKRLSVDPQPGPSKRFKPSPLHIDCAPHKSPRPSAPPRHRSPDRGDTSSEVDSLNLGRTARLRSLPDPSKAPRKHPPALSSDSSPQKTCPDFSELSLKSIDDLRSLLSANEHYRDMAGGMITAHIQKTQAHDIMALSRFLSQTDDRIRALKQRIASLDVTEEIDPPPRPPLAPFPMLPLAPPAAGSSAKHLDPRSTPPPSMASDSSNATLDAVPTANVPLDTTRDVPMADDSPDIIDLDLHDISARTLVVADSDDTYYDKFDPIPDDLVFFDADAPIPSGTTSTAVSVPSSLASAVSGGRIDHTSTPYYKEVISILKNTFKLSTFRTNQLECIVATLDGKDVFYLAPTGGGKSLCFQLPALCVTGRTQGTTFVISPLISLITDQVVALRKKGVRAFPLTSAAEENDVRQAMRMMRSNAEEKPKLVYTTPERLQKSDSLRDVVDQLYEEKQLARFVIDEAHVIGSWGRDFRASYAELNILRKNWPNIPIMALTGSANKDAIEDIKHNLEMRNPVCLAQSFNRPNLHYSVRKKPTVKKDLVQNIAGFIKTHHPDDTGIIYVLSRAESEEMAQRLREDWGIEARHYHAGIENEERKVNQDDWMIGRCKVIVATIAFGMGIDKPDVRFVIHATLSKNMDGYYQETGRAGRDGRSSDCVLFFAYGDAVKIEKMLRNPNNDPTRDKPSDAEIERQVAKLQGVVAYCCNESDCRRALILRHFDEEFKPDDCHNQCDNCHRPGTLIQQDFTTEAQQIIQLLQQMMTVNSRGVTQGQLKDTWKGKNNKTVQQYKSVSLYAAGKAFGHPTIERIFNHLTTEGVISMYRVPCGSGYANTYIQPGNAAQDYLSGSKRLVLSWKEKEEDGKTTKKANAKSSPRKKGKEPEPRPMPDYLNLYDDIEDADDPSEAEVFKDVVDDADMSEPSSSRIPLAGTSWRADSVDRSTAGLQDGPAAVPEDEHTLRLERLKATRLSILTQFKKESLDCILQDDTLQMLALIDPQDEKAFEAILRDCEDPETVLDKCKSYGSEFLAALQELRSCARKSFDAVKMRRNFAFNT